LVHINQGEVQKNMENQEINEPTIKISVFGGSGCGKTTYFASVYKTLKNNSINGFRIDSDFLTTTMLDSYWSKIIDPNSTEPYCLKI
jgi:uridine kinase